MEYADLAAREFLAIPDIDDATIHFINAIHLG